MPLALEMAAAWVDHVPCVEIAASLDDDLAILTKPGAKGPDRHASIHAVFEHSWQLLDLDLRRLLARLSILRGRFDREAAAAVGGGTLFSLSALLDKSLLEATGDGRYQVHELLRQFAAEKLAADAALASATNEAHSIYYCRLCRTLEHDFKGGAQTRAAERMQESLGNIRAAFAWAVEQAEWTRLANASFSLGYFCSPTWPYRGRTRHLQGGDRCPEQEPPVGQRSDCRGTCILLAGATVRRQQRHSFLDGRRLLF